MKSFYDIHLKKLSLMKNIDLTICLNDDGEILLQIKPKIKDTFSK